MKSFKTIKLVWAIGAVVLIALVASAVAVVMKLRQQDALFLVICSEREPQPLRWTCGQVLRHADFSAEQVAWLNESAGARFALETVSLNTAEDFLRLFLARGVDIDAQDRRSFGITALHAAVSDGSVERVQLLLRYGARVDIADQRGRTPLELARTLQAKHTEELRWGQIVDQLSTPGVRETRSAVKGSPHR